ncbi:endonuclease/exonuclease/phosphatase family protein [Oceanibacterium hippocampi]|uniref:Endonuclease/exonuclease/phosphatase domain-containing protein n=1 Tax=Oceanibacterium hippocampi TaxID=745714 RepID=A0A1Y5TXP5_9PROT|nr:endonuclease/exonuclease/phosphatase family protein [Oceanibacterium hippocampi]SLN75255.1 hypothetical protein OCH7691_03826 [Oceanibacterium hippocampi]
MFLAITTATLLLLICTLLPLWRNPHWLVRGMDFPRLQFGFSAVLLLGAQYFLVHAIEFRIGLIGVTLLCLAWQFWWILPYTRIWPAEVKTAADADDSRQLSILTANVLMPNRAAGKLIALVREHQPDVLVTLESDQWWEDQLSAVEKFMPHTIKCPLDNLYGMHVYSRLPIPEESIDFLVQDDVPSMHASVTLRSGDSVRVHFLHPAPPSPSENQESAERDAELVIVARSIAGREPGPVVVAGDLNDVAWSATTRLFRKLSGLLDPRVGRGMFNTYHADYPFMRWPLDHLFHSKHFTVHSISRLPHIGSDHFALLTRLTFSPARGADQEGLEAEADDQAMADEIADEKNVDGADVPRPGATIP